VNLFGLEIKWNNRNGYIRREEFQNGIKDLRNEIKKDIDEAHIRIDDIFKMLAVKK